MTGAKVPAMANGSHQYNDKREASRQSQHGVAGGSRRFARFSRQGHGFLGGSRVPFAWNTCRACRASGGRRAHGTRCDELSRHPGNRRAALRGPHSHCAEGGLWRAWREPGGRGGVRGTHGFCRAASWVQAHLAPECRGAARAPLPPPEATQVTSKKNKACSARA